MSEKPRPYDLNDPKERRRLFREAWGYLHTCRREHHGTDLAGREYAIEALRELSKGTPSMTPHPKALEVAKRQAQLRIQFEPPFGETASNGDWVTSVKQIEQMKRIANMAATAAITAYFDTLEKEGLSREGRAIEYPNGGWGGSAPCENVAVGGDFTVTIIREGK